MNKTTKIKIVKKTMVAEQKAAVKNKKAKRKAAQEIVTTVTDWVSDLRTRKSGETRAAIEQLFGGGPQPNQT